MSKFYNLHYISDLEAYEKGQGIPHHKNFDSLELGTIISYNESDKADSPSDKNVPFGVDVLTIPNDSTTNVQSTMKADGASVVNTHPIFLHPESHVIIKKVDPISKDLVDNDVPVASMPGHMKFTNPDMAPTRR